MTDVSKKEAVMTRGIEYIKPARGDGKHAERVAHKPKFKVAAKIQGELGAAKGKKKSKKRTARKRA